MDGKKVVHRGILFYKSGGSTLKTTIPHAALSMSNTCKIAPLGFYNKNLLNLFEQMGCLKPLYREKIEPFHQLWDPPSRKVRSLDGRMISTRGLGFRESNTQTKKADVLSSHVCLSSYDVEEDKDPLITEAKDAPKELEEGGQSTVDELTEINLGSEDRPRPTYVSASQNEEEPNPLQSLLLCRLFSKEMPLHK